MGLPDSYTLKTSALPAYFDAILDAQPPDRFSAKFLENLGFTSTNDRLFIGILKDLGFLNRDGAPQPRYFRFLDRTQAKKVLAEGIRDGFSELFAINTNAQNFSLQEVKNKLRTLYGGKKTNLVIGNISKTFRALCEYADFSAPLPPDQIPPGEVLPEPVVEPDGGEAVNPPRQEKPLETLTRLRVSALEYHVNIVLPDTRDQAVYDAIFKSLREHLG
jgi:hypothetical protein